MKLVRCLLFLVFLFLLGLGLWWFVQVQPRFTVPHAGFVAGISDDGRRLYLAGVDPRRLEIWDTVAGRMVKKIPVQVTLGFSQISPLKRYLTAVDETYAPLLIDVTSGRICRLPVTGKGIPDYLRFSPDDKYLAVKQGSLLRFVECSTGEVLSTYDPRPLLKEKGFTYPPSGDLQGMEIGRFDSIAPMFLTAHQDEGLDKIVKKGWVKELLIGIRVHDGRPSYAVQCRLNALEPTVLSSNGDLFSAPELNGKFVGVWETASGKLRNKIPFETSGLELNFSRDDRYRSVAGRGAEVWDLVQQKKICESRRASQATFSTDSKLVLLWTDRVYQTVWDLHEGKQLWEKRANDDRLIDYVLMKPKTLWFFHVDARAASSQLIHLDALETKSGKDIAQYADRQRVFNGMHADSTKPFLVVATEEPIKKTGNWWAFWERFISNRPTSRVYVYDSESGHRYRTLVFQGPGPFAMNMSGDGRILVTSQSIGFQVWDLPPRTPWHWIIGIPAALGVIGFAFRFLPVWRRRRVLTEKSQRQ